MPVEAVASGMQFENVTVVALFAVEEGETFAEAPSWSLPVLNPGPVVELTLLFDMNLADAKSYGWMMVAASAHWRNPAALNRFV